MTRDLLPGLGHWIAFLNAVTRTDTLAMLTPEFIDPERRQFAEVLQLG